jgi:hypothetical protein
MSLISYRSLLSHKEVPHANSAGIVLAMPDAINAQPLGGLFALYAKPATARKSLPFVRFTRRLRTASLRALFTPRAALAAADCR